MSPSVSGPGRRRWAGPTEYKGHSTVVCVASKHSVQNAASLLLPEKALFHNVLSMSAHFVSQRFDAFLRKAMSYFNLESPVYSCCACTVKRVYSKRSAARVGLAARVESAVVSTGA